MDIITKYSAAPSSIKFSLLVDNLRCLSSLAFSQVENETLVSACGVVYLIFTGSYVKWQEWD
jgi:hypothetical protein